MASYVIVEPPADRVSERECILRDGFHWLGFLLPLFWLLWHRLWIESALVLAAMLGLSVLSTVDGWTAAVTAVSLALSLYVGLEGTALRLAAMRRRGWREWGVIEADSAEDAETRYLTEARPDPREDVRPRPMAAGRSPAPTAPPVLGLLGYTGRS